MRDFSIFVGIPVAAFIAIFAGLILFVGDNMSKGRRTDGLCSDTLMNRTWGAGIACRAERDRRSTP
jgi:hypothetical protein